MKGSRQARPRPVTTQKAAPLDDTRRRQQEYLQKANRSEGRGGM